VDTILYVIKANLKSIHLDWEPAEIRKLHASKQVVAMTAREYDTTQGVLCTL